MEILEFMTIVFGIVEACKKLGAKGKTLTILSISFGVVLGALWQVAQTFPEFAPWFNIGIVGIAVGLAAGGVYDFINKRLPAKETDLSY